MTTAMTTAKSSYSILARPLKNTKLGLSLTLKFDVSELRKINYYDFYAENTKLFLGETKGDEKIFLKQGDILKVTTDEDHIASKENMMIAVRHCLGFKKSQKK